MSVENQEVQKLPRRDFLKITAATAGILAIAVTKYRLSLGITLPPTDSMNPEGPQTSSAEIAPTTAETKTQTESIDGVKVIPVVYINGFALEPESEAAYRDFGGEERLGLPISDQAGGISPDKAFVRQWFELGALSNEIVGGYPGENLVEKRGKIQRIPVGWKLFIYDQGMTEIPQPGDLEWVEPGDYQIDPKFEAIYGENGGVNYLGIPLTPYIKLGRDEGIQWTPFARLHYKDGYARLDPLGEEYLNELCYPTPEVQSSSLNPGFRYTPELVARIDPEIDRELRRSTEDFVALFYQRSRTCSLDPKSAVYGNFWTYAFHVGRTGEDPRIIESVPLPTFERAYSILAGVRLEYAMNPAVQREAQALEGVMPAINRMMRDNLDPSLFNRNMVPQFPEERILDSVIFGGGFFTYEGLALPYHPALFGYYLRSTARGDFKGSFINQLMGLAPRSFIHNERNQKMAAIDWSSPGGIFANEFRSIVKDMAIRTTGLGESDLPSTLVYVYGVLKEGGAEAPFSAMLNSMIAGSSSLYEEVRGNNLPFAEVFSLQDWRRLPSEVREEIGGMDALYRDEFTNEYMRYTN